MCYHGHPDHPAVSRLGQISRLKRASQVVHHAKQLEHPAAWLRSRRRGGQTLLLLLFSLIALLGILALTFDWGWVLLSQRQMQTGVNAAALEGLRGQGDASYDADDQTLRRERARQLLRVNFDDDLDLAGNSTTIGAGIDRSLVQGAGLRQATLGDGSGLDSVLAQRSNYLFRPDTFALNLDNAVHGDMLVGRFDETATNHAESSLYERVDFTESNGVDPDNGFLIRMRRTHDPDGLDEAAGISSRGGGVPLMLGLLSWMRAEPADAEYSIRRDGVVVRATAISQGQPATAISPATPGGLFPEVSPIAGSTPFVMTNSAWNGPQPLVVEMGPSGTDVANQVRLVGITTLTTAISAVATSCEVSSSTGFPVDSLPFLIRIDSELLAVTEVTGTTWTVQRGAAGSVPASHEAQAWLLWHHSCMAGEPITTWTSLRPPAGGPTAADLEQLPGKTVHSYVPVFTTIDTVERLVGFGSVVWSWNGMTNELTVTRSTVSPSVSGLVGPQGVSACHFFPGLNATDLNAILTARAALSQPLLAPVHVRSIR